MTNIAICISGEPRYWKYAANSIKKLKQSLHDTNIDVFFHLWDEVTIRYQDWGNFEARKVNKQEILDNFKPVHYLWEEKKDIQGIITDAFDYIKSWELTIPPLINTEEKFQNMTRYTTKVTLGQLISMCRSLLLRIEYEKKQNKTYDLVLRARTDVEIEIKDNPDWTVTDFITQREKYHKQYIQFPEIQLCKKPRFTKQHIDFTYKNLTNNLFIPFVEFCFFVSNSVTLNEQVFQNYARRLIEKSFIPNFNENKIMLYQAHCIVPEFLRQYSDAIFESPAQVFKHKLYQFKKEQSRRDSGKLEVKHVLPPQW